jgi:CheY-like chemotaxis protein
LPTATWSFWKPPLPTRRANLLSQHKDIAVALIDVVMETDDAGLRLVEFIRKDLKNPMVRLIIRTGQPGSGT